MQNKTSHKNAKQFIDNNIEPLQKLLPLNKIHEFSEHARLIERTVHNDSFYRTYDYLENQILITAKERINIYFTKRISSKNLSMSARNTLEYKIKNISRIDNIPSFIKDLKLLDDSIDQLELRKKVSIFSKILNAFK